MYSLIYEFRCLYTFFHVIVIKILNNDTFSVLGFIASKSE